jgi:apolipoprotein N-acyltransferase
LELTVWAFALSQAFTPGWTAALAWVSLVRPIWIISALPARDAFRAAFLFVFMFNLFAIWWVAMVTPLGMIAAVVIVAFYYTAILMLFWKLFQIRPLFGCAALPFLWVGLEHFRTLSEFAFPWSDLGYTQASFLMILQSVSVISAHGLSLLIVIVNVLLWQVFRAELSPERRLTSFFASIGIVAALLAYGWIETPPYQESGELEIALLQGSVALEEKWRRGNEQHSFDIYDSLSQVDDKTRPALFVWPETSVPGYLSHDHRLRKEVRRIVRSTESYHLIGSLSLDLDSDKKRYYNACFLIDSDGNFAQMHRKVKLVPFSEHVPYQDYVPFMQKEFLRQYLTFIDQAAVQWWSDFYPGDSITLFEIPEASFGTLICFETATPEYVREYFLAGAQFMVGITNDTWFGNSVGIFQHANMFITRAVENRSWMARVANSGWTFFVDPYGRIREQLELYDVETLRGKVGLLDEFSVFTRIGDIAGRGSWLLTISLVAILAVQWIIRRFFVR